MNKSPVETKTGMRVPFRIALSTILAVLLVATVGGLGVLSYSNLRKNASELTGQVLDETSRRIELWINNLLSKADDQNQLNRAMLGQMKLAPEAVTRIGLYWQRVMESQPYFTFLSVRLEPGGMLSIERLHDGRLTLREARLNPTNNTIELRDFWPEDYRERKPYNEREIMRRMDVVLPWYEKARAAGHPIWLEAMTLRKGAEVVAGVSYAGPIYGPSNEFRGVTTVDFDIVAISKFLASNPVGKQGFAFIVEESTNGTSRVIAHPKPEILTRTATNLLGGVRYEFVPFAELGDGLVTRFMAKMAEQSRLHQADGPAMFTFAADGADYFGSYRRLNGTNLPHWVIASVIPRKEIMGLVEKNNRDTLGIGLVSFVLILFVSYWIAGRVAKPLRNIARDQEAIGRLELDLTPVQHSRITEVDQLMVATHDMKRGLRSFGKYVPIDLVHEILASGQEVELGGRRQILTVFFSDINGFTPIAEQLAPEALVEHLAEYIGEMNQQIREEAGTVDKFIGDSIMAFWGAPTPNPDHAGGACRAALRCQARLAALRAKWQAEGKPLFYQRIGINTAEVIVGNMGSQQRMNYTVIGDHVNTTSRLEGLNRYYGTQIIIGQGTWELVKDDFVARPLDLVSVKGRKAGLRVYELMAVRPGAAAAQLQVASLTATAFEAYLARRFEAATALYEKLLQLDPNDGPAGILLARCRQCLATPPPEGWDGVHHLESK